MKLIQEKDTAKNLLNLINNPAFLSLTSELNKRKDKSKSQKYWTLEEDEKLSKIAKELNFDWKLIAKEFSGRSPVDVEQRWRHRIDPNTKKTSWTKEEDRVLEVMHKKFGGKWKVISSYLPGRLPKCIKNRFYGKIYKQKASPTQVSQEPPSLIDEDEEMLIESFLDLSDNESISSANTSCTNSPSLIC